MSRMTGTSPGMNGAGVTRQLVAAGATRSYVALAVKPTGGRTVCVRRARDLRHLSEVLRRERMVALRTWTLPEWAGVSSEVSLKDQAELHTQLAQLLTRGVPLVEALEATSQTVAPGASPRVERMRELVASGSSFSDAAGAVGIFDPVTTAVYRAAERTGDLGGAAKQLAMTSRRQLRISGKAGTLMIYPAIVLSISLVVTLAMICFVLPKIGASIKDLGTELPAFTEGMMATGVFIRDNALWVGLGALLAVTAAVFARRLLMQGVGYVSRRVPILRDVVLTQESARFFTVMAAMTRNGVTLADALGVAVGVISHPGLRKQLTTLRTRLIEGGVLRSLIDSVESFPLPTRRLLMAAERAGDLESAFDTLAQDTTEELERRSERLLAAMEPVLIVIMFLMIGSLVLSIMIPLIKATTQGVQ
ncbi:MAG: type II secretion system F family protein [Phycisphaeraceae bacterium]|nr:type II secretion system F family protein [Phycisphaeraceae bacterium]